VASEWWTAALYADGSLIVKERKKVITHTRIVSIFSQEIL